MANVNAPFGLRPIRTQGGSPYNGATRRYSVAAGDGTAIFIGDIVTATGVGTGQTINGETLMDVVKAATTDIVTGVVVSVEPTTRDSTPYRAASTQRILNVCDDPNMLFLVQEGVASTALTKDDLGLNISLTMTAGNTATGVSGAVLDNATELTTNTLICKIVEFDNAPDNEVGSVGSRWIVRINRHRHVDQLIGT